MSDPDFDPPPPYELTIAGREYLARIRGQRLPSGPAGAGRVDAIAWARAKKARRIRRQQLRELHAFRSWRTAIATTRRGRQARREAARIHMRRDGAAARSTQLFQGRSRRFLGAHTFPVTTPSDEILNPCRERLAAPAVGWRVPTLQMSVRHDRRSSPSLAREALPLSRRQVRLRGQSANQPRVIDQNSRAPYQTPRVRQERVGK